MVENVIRSIIVPVFQHCAYWVDALLDAVGGSGIVMAAFLVVLVIGLLFLPMRGNAASNIKAYSEKRIHAKKVSEARSKNQSKKGG